MVHTIRGLAWQSISTRAQHFHKEGKTLPLKCLMDSREHEGQSMGKRCCLWWLTLPKNLDTRIFISCYILGWIQAPNSPSYRRSLILGFSLLEATTIRINTIVRHSGTFWHIVLPSKSAKAKKKTSNGMPLLRVVDYHEHHEPWGY